LLWSLFLILGLAGDVAFEFASGSDPGALPYREARDRSSDSSSLAHDYDDICALIPLSITNRSAEINLSSVANQVSCSKGFDRNPFRPPSSLPRP
jgi:hypothetical protein